MSSGYAIERNVLGERAQASWRWAKDQRARPLGKPADQWRERTLTNRDSQRSRLYAAERTLPEFKTGTLTLEQCAAEAERAVRNAFGVGASVRIHDGRGCRNARGSGWANPGFGITLRLVLPCWARTHLIVLHEAAHGVCCALEQAGDGRQPSHGRLFAQVYLRLVAGGMGRTVEARLRQAFKAGRVRYLARRVGRVGVLPPALRAAACRQNPPPPTC